MDALTVDEAIRKGRLQLYWAPFFIFASLFFPVLTVFMGFIATGNIPVLAGTLLVLFTIPFFCYLLRLPRWRIWAFSNVRNVHELKQRALLAGIYPKENSILWRLQITTAEQKLILQRLEQRFQLPDVFEDDYSLPGYTTYSYRKSDQRIYVFFALAFCLGAITAFSHQQILAGLFCTFNCLLASRMAYLRSKTTEPVLTISEDGIAAVENGFHSWNDIRNERIIRRSGSYYNLCYELKGETITVSLAGLLSHRGYKADHVLRTYRGRYEARSRK